MAWWGISLYHVKIKVKRAFINPFHIWGEGVEIGLKESGGDRAF